MRKRITGHAPAKLNLFLDVLRKRSGGYHELATVFLPLPGLYDEVCIVRKDSPGVSLSCEADGVPCDHRNLVWQAATEFAKAAGMEAAWHMKLIKHIPVAAGLGGGSSDAATALRLLNKLCGWPLAGSELWRIGAGLGADVPFFLDPQISLGSGRGDILEPLHSQVNLSLVLVNPGFPISSSWAYTHLFPELPHPDIAPLTQALAAGDPVAVGRYIYNVFEQPAVQKFPLLEIILNAVKEVPGCLGARMSGSGPTIFGIFDTEGQAVACARQVTDKLGTKIWTKVLCVH